jgi:glycosyltransferase involved in cell wall biosynthesis
VKILISAHAVWWNASIYYAVTAAQALVRRGHEVTFIAHDSIPAYQQAKKRGLRVIGDMNLSELSPVSLMRNQTRLRQLLLEERFDLLNPHRPEDHSHLALANRLTGRQAKLVRTISDVRYPANNAFNRRLHERYTDGLIFCARCCQDRYRQTNFRLSKLPQAVIHSALDVDAFRSGDWKQDQSYRNLGYPCIGLVARLSPNKGHRTLIEAAVLVLREFPQARFLIIGQEEEISVASLKAYAREQRVEEAFIFTGRLEDPRPALAACDIGVIASTASEVISRAAQEFFALGIPVIATTVNVLPEMVTPGVNGFLFNPGDSAALARALLDLAGSSDLRVRLGEGALQSARTTHDLSVLGRKTEEFFSSVLQSGTP